MFISDQFQHFSVVGQPGSLSKLHEQLAWPALEYPREIERLGKASYRHSDRSADRWVNAK